MNPAAELNSLSTAPIQMEDDAALLQRFITGRCDEAFNLLVARHINRVFATARRHVHAADLAEDVTQAVFILLATKARKLPKNAILAGWLHRATCLTARHALRSQNRRRIHEQRAAEMKQEISTAHEETSPSAELLAAIDIALAQLNQQDRDVLVLRYFQAKSLAEVGQLTGISEEAATKRVQRALVKTRTILARRHIQIAETAIPAILISPPAHAPAALAAHVIHTALAAAHGGLIGGSALALAKGASFAVMGLRAKIAAACLVTAAVAGAAIVTAAWLLSKKSYPIASMPKPSPTTAIAIPQVVDGPIAPDIPAFQALPVNDPSLAAFPYAPGWPRVLPGAIFCSPAVADLEGNGKLDIIVTCAPSASHSGASSHPAPNPLPLMFALRPDGTSLPGWPVIVGSERQARPPHTSPWVSSPSIFRNHDGRDEVVERGPGGAPIFIVGANRAALKITSGNPASSIPLVDFNNDGTFGFSVGKALSTVEGKDIPGWPANLRFRSGFAPCIGDALGDGQLKLYQLFYSEKGLDIADVAGYDAHGNKLPGWPNKIQDPTWEPPVMGDVTGDGKMDVICVGGNKLYAWTWDGKPLPNTTTDEQQVGILKTNIMQYTASPALADIDGDGKAEIIVYDENTRTIRAWHGDGIGVGNEKSPATQPDSGDGVIAEITGDAHGVSVVSLGDDPHITDFFAGSWWVRRYPDGTIKAKNMIPGLAQTEWTQPTIADVEGNGKADVIFGTSDGRLFVYRTGLAYHPERMQWPTAHGNFQRTGVWKRPRAATKPQTTIPPN